MSSSSDTSFIDNKKQEESKSSNASDYMSNIISFLSFVIILFICIVIYYTESGLLVYGCKLAQSNILPTDVHCSPYTDIKPSIQSIQTNIFTAGDQSMKLNFPYNEYNSQNYILDMFREYKNEPNSNFLANYLISMIESIIHFNYSALNKIFNVLNGVPEFIIVLFGPILFAFISTILFIFDHLYFIYLWFAKMGWFFKTNANDSTTGNPQWEDVTIISPFNYGCAIGLVILFVIIFFFALPFISIISSLSMLFCILSCISYQSILNSKNVSAIQIIQDIFKYYKTTIMGTFSFFVIVSAFSNLGIVSGIFSIIVLLLIYFGTISIDLFNPIKKDNLSPLVSFTQAKKTCSYKESAREKHGLLYNLLFGQKGGTIVKDIKELGKRLSKK